MASEAEPKRAAGAARPRLATRQLLRGIGDSFHRGRPRLWWAAAFLVAGFAVAIYLGYMQRRDGGIVLAVTTGLARLLVAQLGMVALYRAVLRPEEPLWRIDASTFRFIGGSLAILALIAGLLLLSRLWVMNMAASLDVGLDARVAFRVISLTAVAVLLSCAFLRTQPWLAALATGRRDVSLPRSWAETTGSTWTLVGVWLLLVMPLMIAEVLLSLAAANSGAMGPSHFAYALAEAGAVTAIAVSTALLNASVLRWIDGEV